MIQFIPLKQLQNSYICFFRPANEEEIAKVIRKLGNRNYDYDWKMELKLISNLVNELRKKFLLLFDPGGYSTLVWVGVCLWEFWSATTHHPSMYQFWRKSDPSLYHGIWGQAHPCTTVYYFWPPIHVPVGKIHPWRYQNKAKITTLQRNSDPCELKLNDMSTIAVPVIENLRPIDVPMIKNGPSMYLNDKKWPIDVLIKTGTPIHVPHFRKKKDPLMYLAAWFCDPCLRHIPITIQIITI